MKANKQNRKIDLFWKARDFKPWQKSTDWYWVFWIVIFSFMGILIYFYEDYIFSTFIFLMATLSVIGHTREPTITEYRINDKAIIMDNGKREILFDEIEDFNIDYEEGLIFINTKEKYKKLLHIPFEATHNIAVIEQVLSSKLKKNEDLFMPFLEKLIQKMLGF